MLFTIQDGNTIPSAVPLPHHEALTVQCLERVVKNEALSPSYNFLIIIIVQSTQILMLKAKLVVKQGQKVMGLYLLKIARPHTKRSIFLPLR